MSIRTRLSIVLAAVVLPAILIAGLVAGIVLPRTLSDGQRRDVDRAAVALATTMSAECWALGDRAEVIALSVANGRAPQAVLDEETRGGLGAERGYAVVLRGGAVLARSAAAPVPLPTTLPTTECSDVSSPVGAALSERVDLPTDRGTLSVLVVEPLTSGRLDALARQAAVGSTRVMLACGGGQEVHTSSDRGRASIVQTVPAGSGRPCAVEGSAPDPGSGPRTWLPLLLLTLVAMVAVVLVRWLARELTRPVTTLRDGARRIAEGDLGVRLPDDRRDEVGDLAREFNAMAGELERRLGELERSRETLRETTDQIAATLRRTHDLDGLLAALCALAETTTRSPSASVWLREGRTLRSRVQHPIGSGRPDASRVRIGDGTIGAAAGDNRVAATADAAEPGATRHGRLCAAPLVSGDDVLGVLVVERSATDEPYDDATSELLEVVAGPAGVAIDNAMMHRRAQRQSVVDPLTGVGNLRMLTGALRREVERAQAFGRSAALLVVDIDDFRSINEELGHTVGDGVLKALARRLEELVNPVDLVARYGGEEMAVLCPERDQDEAVRLAESVLADLRARPLAVGDVQVPVRCSIGVATWPEHGPAAIDVLSAADAAMAAAKAGGRDRVATAGASDPSPR